MTARVVLDELGPGEVCRLTDEQAAVLSGLSLVELRKQSDGSWLLQPTDRVGVVRCGDLELQVRPKVGIARLLFLLGYARDPGFRPFDVDGVSETDLWPALAHSLARQAERCLARGVLQGYVTVEEALPLVRGRVRLADQLSRRPGILVPLEVRYDDYAADIAENQILRTAVRRLRSVPTLNDDLRARLAHLDARLQPVRIIPYGAPAPTWLLTRVNARYAPALRLADLVLRDLSFETGPGGLAVTAFVVTMSAVFEDFVTTALREALAPYPGSTCAQYVAPLDEQHQLIIRPDVVHLVGGEPAAIFDAKYKVASTTGRYGNHDTYQMLTYCSVLRVPTGYLVYASGAKSAGAHRIRNTDIDVVYWPLDLAEPPHALLTQISALASAALAQWRDRASESGW